MKYSKAFAGVDSFLNHATNAVQTPGVVLFGPTTPVVWGHDGNINIYRAVDCAPCVDTIGKGPCPNHWKCMDSIGVDEVVEAITETLGRFRNRNAH